jgi:hypothetical protein
MVQYSTTTKTLNKPCSACPGPFEGDLQYETLMRVTKQNP